MSWQQIVTPNLDPVVVEAGKILTDWYGWCLATVESAFNTPRVSPSAWAAWLAIPAAFKHEDRNWPRGVYFLIFYTGDNGMGHVAIAFINANGQMGIWTSPYEHVPYFYTGYHSVDTLGEAYRVTYVGWATMVAGKELAVYVEDPAPAAPAAPSAPAAAPANPGGSYNVVKTIPGYITSNDAFNHTNQAGTVAPGIYSVFNQSHNMVNVTSKPGQPGSWINPSDNVSAPAAPPTPYTQNNINGTVFAVEPGAPKAMYVTKIGGAEKWNFQGVTTWRDFKSTEHVDYGTEVFIVGTGRIPIPPNGATYLMVDADFGDFVKTGKPTNYYGFSPADLSETKPPALPEPVNTVAAPAAPVAPPAQVSTPPANSTTPINWQETYVRFPSAVKYIAVRNISVTDISEQQPALNLPQYKVGANPEVGVVTAYGTVTKDSVEYYRLGTTNDPGFKYWYCVPKLDPETKTPLLLVKPTVPTTPQPTKLQAATDTVGLAKSILNDTPKFLDDIMPKWFKNKK